MPKPYAYQLWHHPGSRNLFRRHQATANMVADTLAYAAVRGIPFGIALGNLAVYSAEDWAREHAPPPKPPPPQGFWRSLLGLCREFLSFGWFFESCAAILSAPWRWWRGNVLSPQLRRLVRELENGAPLSYALEKHLGEHLPTCFILALEQAENHNRVAEVLPALAEGLRYPRLVTADRQSAFALGLLRLAIILPIIGGMAIFIVPKFAKIFDELMPGEPCESFWLSGSTPSILSWVAVLIEITLVVGFTGVVLSKFDILRAMILTRLPFFRRDVERLWLAEMVTDMLALLKAGDDLLTAAQWTRAATPHPWVARKLDVFARLLAEGRDWPTAWAAMDLGLPLADWLMQNAAAREDPVGALELLLDKLHLDVDTTTSHFQTLADPLCVLILGTVVGAWMYTMFGMLTRITAGVAGW